MAISLERLHATFFPFRHRFVRKWVHGTIIIVIWLIAVVSEVAQIFLEGIANDVVINTSLYILFSVVSLFVICIGVFFVCNTWCSDIEPENLAIAITYKLGVLCYKKAD